MRRTRILAIVTAMVATLVALTTPKAEAAQFPDFPLALPVAFGAVVQGGGPHTHVSGVQSSIDLGASGNVSVPVVAAADGIVTVKSTRSWSRCYVVIQHADGWQTQYYHLKSIPAGLQDGQKVVAGQKIGMTGMPGSETCGRGTFRHVHFSLYRNGVEMPISGLKMGGYSVYGTGSAYCGYWKRNSDGVITADARRACLAVPSVNNNIVNPTSLIGTQDGAGAAAPAPSPAPAVVRPVIADHDTIDAAALYITEGQHTVGGRAWRTSCEPYSRTERCTTEIWATQVKDVNGKFVPQEGWFWNNLTYKPLDRGAYADNPLGFTGTWTSTDGRKWRTECDTAATGRNGCRSYIYATVIVATAKADGGYSYAYQNKWTLNSMVRFTVAAPAPTTTVRPNPASVSVTPYATATPTASPKPTVSPTATPSPTPSVTPSPSATPSAEG